MFQAGQPVLIVSCADDPRAEGLPGEVIDEAPPSHLTDYRWTVSTGAFFIGTVLCHTHELRPINQ